MSKSIAWYAKAGILLVALVASKASLSRLPEVIATHWNAAGQPDSYGPRTLAVLIVPGVMLFLLALFAALPKLSPKGYDLESQRGVLDGTLISVLVFLLFVHVVILAVGLGLPVRIERAVPFGVSVLFVALGAFIARAKPNFYVGVRTPWTLTSEANWTATHRFTARLFVLGGLSLALASLAGASFWLVFAGFMTLGVLPVGYSLVYWINERAA